MANISDTVGNISVEIDTKEALDALKRAFSFLDDGSDYVTILEKSPTVYKLADGRWGMKSSFVGSGRWYYQENIRSMFEWLTLPDEEPISPEDQEILTNANFTIVFVYEDYEPSCELFGQGVDKLEHKTGTPLDETLHFPLSWVNYDLSWGNRLAIGFEDEDEFLDRLNGMDDDEASEFLEEEKDGLERFYGTDLGDLIDHWISEQYCSKRIKDIYERFGK